MPFWALLVLHYGSTWGLHFSLTATPKFLSEVTFFLNMGESLKKMNAILLQVLGFNLTKAGFLSSAPHLARILLGFVFGTLGDVVRRRQLLSVTNIRKTFCIFCKRIKFDVPLLNLLASLLILQHIYCLECV